MFCSLKFIVIVSLLHHLRTSGSEGVPRKENSQMNSIFTFSIGGGILAAILMLLVVVTCLYFKVAKALRAQRLSACLALKNNPPMVTQDKFTASTSITSGCYPNTPYCEECNLYADSETLPPCYCNVNEGL